MLRDFWRDFTAPVDEIKDLRVGEVLEALNEMLGPHIFPAKEDGSRSALLPDVRHGPPEPQDLRQVRRLHRLRQLSRVPLHAPAHATSATATARRQRPTASCSATTPTTGLAVTLRTGRFGPYVQLGEGSEDEKPKRSSLPKGVDAGDPRSRATRCSCCRCRARSACIPRPASRSPPASAATGRSSCTTARTPTSTASRTCSASASTAP